MLKNLLALAAVSAVLVTTAALSAGEAPMPIDGRTILPSIPPLPPLAEPEPKAVKSAPTRKASVKKLSGKAEKGTPKSGASKAARARPSKAKPTRKARRAK